MTDVRPATDAELAHLPDVERAADRVFAAVGITGLPPAADLDEFRGADAVLVSGDPPVGFARIDVIAGEPYLSQLSVHPTAMRCGIGSALLEAAVDWVVENGHDSLALATFRDIAWNAPFYSRHGFVEVTPPLTPGLELVRQHEHDLRLERFGPRVIMRRSVRQCGETVR
jgi:GNAT superfamily N-acetyltransferase